MHACMVALLKNLGYLSLTTQIQVLFFQFKLKCIYVVYKGNNDYFCAGNTSKSYILERLRMLLMEEAVVW